MKPLNRLLIALVFGGTAANVYAGCDQPALVVIPPPEELDEDNRGQIIADTEQYFQAMREYVTCIRAELDSAGVDASELYQQVLVQRNNQAVAEAEAVQRWFYSRFPAESASNSAVND